MDNSQEYAEIVIMFVTICIAIALISLGIGWSAGISMLRKRKAILQTPQHDATEPVTGMSAMEGVAQSISPVFAPFSGREVVYCEAKAKQFKVEKKKIQSHFTEMIYESVIDYPFLLKSAEGCVVVCPEEGFADLVHTFDATNYSNKIGGVVARVPDPAMALALDGADISYLNEDGPVPIDFSESSLHSGEDIFVMGMRYHEPDAIEKILEGHPVLEKEKIVGLFRHSEAKKEGLYLAPGNTIQAVGELRKYGISFIVWSTIIAAIAAAVAMMDIL